MSRSTIDMEKNANRRGFTLVEMMFALVIGFFVIAAAWASYVMIWQWWAEMSPRLDAQRTARIALLSVIEGVTGVVGGPDPVAGTFTVGDTTYKRRNGIAWATAYPSITAGGGSISYRLVPDSSNARMFFVLANSLVPEGALYYKHTDGKTYEIPSTRGISEVKFEKFVDSGGAEHDNIIKVTATVDRDISGTRAGQYNIKVVYTDTVYLRNAL